MPFDRSWTRVQGAIRRRASKWLGCNFIEVRPARPIISFTFDDFPRSALSNGGRILEEHSLVGTFYTSLGLEGQDSPTGQIFHYSDLDQVVSRGHELGCHTFDHCNSWTTPPAAFEASVVRNAQALARLLPGQRFETLSYPIDHPRPGSKRRVARHVDACREGGQTFNLGKTDLNRLAAYFIERSRENPEAIKGMIQANQIARGWLIFATHDVCERPTRFGCTTDLFRQIVECSVASGAEILPVARALGRVRSQAKGNIR